MNMRLMPKSFIYIAPLGSLGVLFPLLYTLSTSLMSEAESAVYPPPLLPEAVNLSNFAKVIDTIPVLTFIGNSLVVSIAIMLRADRDRKSGGIRFRLPAIPGKRAVQPLSRHDDDPVGGNHDSELLDGQKPELAGHLSRAHHSISGHGLRDLSAQTDLPAVPKELFEAARVDGRGHVRIFLSMVPPLSIPGIATLGVYSFLNHWNMYLWPLLTTNRVEMRTVQIGIGMFAVRRDEFMESDSVRRTPSAAAFPAAACTRFEAASPRHYGRCVEGLTGPYARALMDQPCVPVIGKKPAQFLIDLNHTIFSKGD